MLTTGFKLYFGFGIVLLLAAVFYGWTSGGVDWSLFPGDIGTLYFAVQGALTMGWRGAVGDHLGYVVLLSGALAAFTIGGFMVAFRDNDSTAVAEVAGTEQAWTAEGWVDRFALPFPADATGYGQGDEEVAAVRADAALLLGYYDAVHARTLRYLDGVTEADLDRVVDERFDPPVTLGVRLVSVADDDIQHSGQAAFVRGVVDGG